MNGVIYSAKNRIDGKVYVGQTKNLNRRMHAHKHRATSGEGGAFYEAIRQYGFESFDWSILETCEESRLNETETYWIKSLGTNCYNLIVGSRHSEQTKEKFRLAGIRRGMAAGATEKAAETNRGKHRSNETKEKQRRAALGRRWSPEMIEHFRNLHKGNGRHKGFHHSEETKEKCRQAALRQAEMRRATA